MRVRTFITWTGKMLEEIGMQFIQLLTDSGETKVYTVIVVK